MKPLRILSYTFANHATGYGHLFRSLALAQEAQRRGHTVYVASDRQPPAGLAHIPTQYNDPVTFSRALIASTPDWLIVDIPHTPPDWVRGLAKCRILTLNGIGYNQNDGADLRIVQGVDDIDLPGPQDKVPVLKGVEYVILRPELTQYIGMAKGQEIMVWGGAADMLKIHQAFFCACPGWFAVHVVSDMVTMPIFSSPTQTALRVRAESEAIFGWLASSRALVCAMGMICMEAAYLQLPQWVFSYSDLHLRFAKGLERLGLIKAYPTVGLPGKDEMRAFLEQPFEPTGRPPDLEGARRVMEAIENYG